MESRRVVQLKVFYWYTEEVEGNTVIHVGGRTAENKTVHALINNFTCGVNVELPKRIAWDKQKATVLFKYLKDSMGTQGPIGDFKLFKKSRLHYLEEIYTIFLKFRSEKAAKTLSYRCSNARGFFVPRLAQFWADDFKVHEANIDPILKLSAAKNIELANWIEIKETIILDDDGEEVSIEDRKFTTADIDMNVDCDDVKRIQPPKGVYVAPTYCSFDIECNSNNHNSKMPDPTIPENVVMQISMIFGTLYDPKRNHILITLGQPRKKRIKTCDELVVFNSETELLLGFSKLIKRYDPDLFFHYNGLKFDWDYMIKRTELLGIFGKFSDLGRIIGKKAELRVMKWSSQAYGEQKFSYLECHGRTNVDILIEIERNHRLPNYTLNTVAARFLGQQKEDLSARDLFMIWDLTNEVLPEVINRKLSPKDLILYRSKVDRIFENRKCGPIVKVYREKLLKASAVDFPELCREGMELMGTYCIQDTVLPIELVEKLNMWTSMEAMSNVTHVPVSYLHTRGQQIKVLSQVYRECIPRNIVIPTLKKTDTVEKFQGATVIEANAGDYEDVATLDFASLYPTVMIAYNISYDTILRDDDPTPDSECHVLEFKSHVGCEHDEQKRKKKAEDVLCRDYRYRFRKVKYIIDKEGNVKREHEGVMPRLERNLMASRKVAKKEMAKVEAVIKTNNGTATEDDVKFYKKMNWKIVEKGSLNSEESSTADRDHNTWNANQLALKISCNSCYGVLGVNNGMLPLIAGAASVTAMGRRLIMMAIDRIKSEYVQVRLVYGDSVSADTPILCRLNGVIFYRTIDNLPSENAVVDDVGEKEYIVPVLGLEVWTEKGFTRLNKIIKHKTTKKMYRVLTYTGCVDVTEDHSLLNERAEKIRPKNVKVGDKLLHADLPSIGGNLSSANAYSMGKTCVNTDQLCKYIEIIQEFDTESRQAFFDGYCDSHISEKQDNYFTLNCASKLEASSMYLIASSLGYHTRIDMNLFKSYYILNFMRTGATHKDPKIKRITELPPTEQYVYDLETENHHFSAGVGRMVVHNTDSCMIRFVGKTLDESWQLAEEASKVATHAIKCYIVGVEENHTIGVDKVPIAKFTPEDKRFNDLTFLEKCQVLDYHSCPIDLEFENLYKRFLLLTKKRYFAYSVNRKGELLSITKKGIVLTRRDNSKYLRDSYETVIKGVLDDLCEQDIMYRLYDRIQLLFTRQIAAPNLIIYMGVKTILNYAKSRKEKKGRTVVSQVPIDCNGTLIDDLVGPLDPRLVYPNLPQVLLALKMMRRGEDIPPNSRLEFLYLQTKDWTHQGQKAEDYTYYKENKDIENLKPDNLHYIEKQLANPIAELLSVKFSKGIIPFVDTEDRFRFQIGNLKSDHRVAVARQTLYNKSRYIGKKLEKDILASCDKVFVGWKVLEKEGYIHDKTDELSEDKDFTTYTFKKYSAQAAYVLDEMKYNDDIDSMSKEMYPEFYELCLWYKSCETINTLHKQFGMKKRRWIRPTRVADKLQPNVKIVMISNSFEDDGVNKGDTGKIIERFEFGTKQDMQYTYNILFGNNEISGKHLKNVPRNLFTTYTVKDGNIMDNIFEYRKRYSEVVEHMNEIFSPVEFTD